MAPSGIVVQGVEVDHSSTEAEAHPTTDTGTRTRNLSIAMTHSMIAQDPVI